MTAFKKLLAASLPIGLAAAMLTPGQMPEVHAATDYSSLESPAELRLTALDKLMKGDKSSALELFEGAIRLAQLQFGSDSTFLGDLYYEAGKLYLDQDQFNQAEIYLKQATKICPKNASARLALARLLDKQRKVSEALNQVKEALMSNPSSPVARQKFVQILSKNGHSPSDIAMATAESLNVANLQKATREAFRALTEGKNEAPPGPQKLSVPKVPKNIKAAPEEGEADKGESAAKDSAGGAPEGDTGAGAGQGKEAAASPGASTETKGESKTENKSESGAKMPSFGGFSLFPLKDMAARKEKEEKEQQGKTEAAKKAEQEKQEEAKKQSNQNDMVQRLKEQVKAQERARASERAQREELARQARAAREEARAAKAAAAASAKQQPKTAKAAPAPAAKADAKTAKSEGKPAKTDTAKTDAPRQEAKTAEQKPQPQQQQQPPQMMQQPGIYATQYMPPQIYQMAPVQQVYTPPPKSKGKAGFVPPPPPLAPAVYPGMMPMAVPQIIPQPRPAPAPAPKVEKPKPAPEPKPAAEDKPPPMTSGDNDDPTFLMDWAEIQKKAPKKKSK